MSKLQELKDEIYELEQKEREDKEILRRESNYEKFKERPEDWIVGKAHCETNFKDNGWHHPKGQQFITKAVDIHGNCGHVYYPTAWITESTYTYFHNVWKHEDKQNFQEALNSLVQKEVEKIMKKLIPTLEIMGLQSTYYNLENDYPLNKVEEIKKDIWGETKKILDTYSDEEFLKAKRGRLSHGNGILMSYIRENRPHLLN